MVLIIGMIFTMAIIWGAKDFIKSHPKTSYIISLLVSLGVIYLYFSEITKGLPKEFVQYFLNIFKRGIFATTIFMIVMYLGCVTKHNSLTKKLMNIRGEISIIGCIFALTHNIIYGRRYFIWLLFDRTQFKNTNQFIAAILSAILVVLMIILMVTSFKCVRNKMTATSWKNIQRLAYPFFYIIYIHIMTLYATKFDKKIFDIVVYTIIYLTYTILRIRKYKLQKASH